MTDDRKYSLKFISKYPPYNAGDVAGFTKGKYDSLIAAGKGTPYSASKIVTAMKAKTAKAKAKKNGKNKMVDGAPVSKGK